MSLCVKHLIGRLNCLATLALLLAATTHAATPILTNNTARPLRYYPIDGDFVITNGPEYFNRPLYGPNTAFRIDAGDKPQFSLFLPGRGGNLRLGVKSGDTVKWLDDAEKIIARYRPGSMLYEITDPILAGGTIQLTILPLDSAEGLIIRAELHGTTAPLELITAFGGVNGDRGSRNGDIGCERVPVSQFFQLKPEYCRGNIFSILENCFTLRNKNAEIRGTLPLGAKLAFADSTQWDSLNDLLLSARKAGPLKVIAGWVSLTADHPIFIALEHRHESSALADIPFYTLESYEKATNSFTAAEQHRKAIAEKIIVETPDPFINAAAPAICVAANAVWDGSLNVFMHGAVAWRSKLLGWRGPYSGDALGWHERTAQHLDYWTARQNTREIPDAIAQPDPAVNLTRDEAALHSNGDMSNSHYDMNLVAIDALFRHLLWTGDLDYARKMWPVIQRHLAWEQRLFRRPFGADKLPLYEAYCCIWASDNMQYDGGGVAYSSAYNYYHNHTAARLAKLIGEDAAPYEREAESIRIAMKNELWLPDRGWFGENKDLLGLQLVHSAAGLWTFYHTVDSEASNPFESWQMSRFVDTQIAHIPIHGPGVPEGNYFTLPTSDWMPYMWSINNVVMAEVAHTSLAFWQAGRDDQAFGAFKGCLLDSMYLGLCPGNVGAMTHFDTARGEAQRDFADGIGATSRSLIEGLFGVKPDAVAGELVIRPGFPAEWNFAKLRHADLNFSFQRDGLEETYVVESKFPKLLALRLHVPALRDHVASLTVNGTAVKWQTATNEIGAPRIEIQAAPSARYEVRVVWSGEKPATSESPAIAAKNGVLEIPFRNAALREIADPQNALGEPVVSSNVLRATVKGAFGERTVFAKVQQGDLAWWLPLQFEIRPAHEIIANEIQDGTHIRFRIHNNTPVELDSDATLRIAKLTTRTHLTAPAFGDTVEIAPVVGGILPGTSDVEVQLDDGSSFRGTVVNWQFRRSKNATKWECVELSNVFNEQVTAIFQQKYLAPRSPFCSLSIPVQGDGGWCDYSLSPPIDDTGLRTKSADGGGRFFMPQGVPFATPSTKDAKNIAFTSQWDNFPRSISVPLTNTASHLYLLMAGSANPMQSQLDNGEVIVAYADGSTEHLALCNPSNWWPIDQDYFIDDYGFKRGGAIPPRVDLKTGAVRTLDAGTFKGQGGTVRGGAASVLDLPLNSAKELKSLTVNSRANEVVIGLMAATLARE